MAVRSHLELRKTWVEKSSNTLEMEVCFNLDGSRAIDIAFLFSASSYTALGLDCQTRPRIRLLAAV